MDRDKALDVARDALIRVRAERDNAKDLVVGLRHTVTVTERERDAAETECAALRARAERAEEALREAQKPTCAASAPGVPSPTKGSDAGGDGIRRDGRTLYVLDVDGCNLWWAAVQSTRLSEAEQERIAMALHDDTRTDAAPSRGGDAATRPDRPATSLLKPEPDPADVVSAFFAEKEGR